MSIKIVDFGAAQTLHCQIMVDGDWADFDPTDTEANIKAAIEAIPSMSGHTVTVTEITSNRKWSFNFNFTPTTFSATIDNLVLRLKCDESSGDALDTSGQGNHGDYSGSRTTDVMANNLTFSNTDAVNLINGSHFTTGVTDFPSGTGGATISFRYRNPITASNNVAISIGQASGPLGFQLQPNNATYNGYVDNLNGSYGTFSAPTDTEWHIMTIRFPSSASLGHSTLISDLLLYIDGVLKTISASGHDGVISFGTVDNCMIGDYFPNPIYPFNGCIDNILVFDNDIGDSAAKALNSYSTASTGCVLCLRCDEGTGTTLTDESSSSNDSTDFDGLWFSKSNLAFSNPFALDLTDGSYIEPGTTGVVSVSDGLTVFFRFKLPTATLNTFFSMGSATGPNLYIGYYTSYGLYFGVSTTDSSVNVCYATTGFHPSTDWVTVALRVPPDGASPTIIDDCFLYIDGVSWPFTVAMSGDVTTDTTTLRFGDRAFTTNTYPSYAYMDHILVFDSDIGDTATKTLNTYDTPSSGCVLMLKCDQGSGTDVLDSTSNNNDATCSGDWAADTVNSVVSMRSLTFANTKALDLTDSGYATTGITNFPMPDDGATIFVRFKKVDTLSSNVIFSINGAGAGDEKLFYLGYYDSYSGLYLHTQDSPSGGGSYGTGKFTWTPDTNWHTVAIRIPDAVTLGHTPLMSEVAFYFDGVVQTLNTTSTDHNIEWTGLVNAILGAYYGGDSGWDGYAEQFLIFRGDKGDTFAKALNTYNPNDMTITITDGSGTVTYRSSLLMLLNI